jgi:uncharacterized protein
MEVHMQPFPLARLWTSGDLYRRAMLNYDRLELPDYQLPAAFRPLDYDWPGDAEGRLLMALILLAQATHREPKYLDELLAELPKHLNARGYLGPILPAGVFSEQQFSGHGWMLRALSELYLWRKDTALLRMIERMLRGLVLPARGYYKLYPSLPEQRVFKGEAIGHAGPYLAGNWYPSTDIGCAFTMLDGASQAYQLLPSVELAELLEEMIECYAVIDIRRLSFQTHSTLSALRGVLRYYALKGRSQDLALVRRVYALYRGEAMTENFANYNWFGRPTWTEPCAVIDSFIVAHQLWQSTGETGYLEDAQRILYNGMAYGQRPNGGYGCDLCAGASTPYLAPKVDVFEAPWCCTMRGGEGLARAAEFSHLIEQDKLYLPYYGTSLAAAPFADGELWLEQRSDYPHSAEVSLEIVRDGPPSAKTICLYIPSWAAPGQVSLALNGTRVPVQAGGEFVHLKHVWHAGDRIVLDLGYGVRCEPAVNQHSIAGQHAFWHGPLLLGIAHQAEMPINLARDPFLQPLGGGRFKVDGTDYLLAPTDNLYTLPPGAALCDRRQVLFADSDAGR